MDHLLHHKRLFALALAAVTNVGFYLLPVVGLPTDEVIFLVSLIVTIVVAFAVSEAGPEDVEIVDSVRTAAAEITGEKGFTLRLPLGPYSFSGSLITLSWALELVALPDGGTERVDLVVAPTPVEVRLDGLDREPRGHTFKIGSKQR